MSIQNPVSLKKPDFEESYRRYEAFFHGETLDRPPVSLPVWHPRTEQPKAPVYANQRDRWMDVEFRARMDAWYIENTDYLGDAIPTIFPNLGPEVFSAYCGTPYIFGPDTTWTEPCVFDWAKDGPKAVVDMNNEYFKATEKYTRELLRLGHDKFIVGFTDMHAGADHLAALRDPAVLNTDLYDFPDEVKAKLASSDQEFFELYDYFYDILAEGQYGYTTAWINLPYCGRYNVTQNDFCCMVSEKMFHEFFLPGMKEETAQLERSIYHLDGPGALQHMDAILEIPGLNAMQWVMGAGNEGFARWIKVYQKIQKAHKGVYVNIDVKELDLLFESLRPDGVWLPWVSGVGTAEDAAYVLERVKKWK